MTLRELFNDAVKYDEPKLAYTIYWASQNGISLDQNYETLKNADVDFREVDELIKSNPLGIQSIRLYSCKEGSKFHLILARDEQEAKGEILTRYGYIPAQVHDVSHGMDNSLWDSRKNKSEWIRGIKDSAIEFPVYLGLIGKE